MGMPPGLEFKTADLRWPVEEVTRTPSRTDGVSEREERKERFAACDYARALVRKLFSNDRQLEEQSNRVQVLTCWYLQLFYMFRSLKQEEAKTVAVAAAFLGCKVMDLPRRMRGVLRALNQQRTQGGEPELGEDDQKSLWERVLRVELVLLRIVRFDFDPPLPTGLADKDDLPDLAKGLLVQLTLSEAFRAACTQPPQQEAKALTLDLLKKAENFARDSFMGFAPLLAPPRFIAAGALAIATRHTRREMTMAELVRLLEVVDPRLANATVKAVIDEILNVFRTKNSFVPKAAPAVAKAGPPNPAAAAEPGPPKAGPPNLTAAAKAGPPAFAPAAQAAAPAAAAGPGGTALRGPVGAKAAVPPAQATSGPPAAAGATAPVAPAGAGGPPAVARAANSVRASARSHPYSAGSA